MCIRWLINWSDCTKMHGATIRFQIMWQFILRPHSLICIPPWLVVLLNSAFIIDVCFCSAYCLLWQGFCGFPSSLPSANNVHFHNICSSVSACDSLIHHHAALAPLVICNSGTVADNSTNFHRFIRANSYSWKVTLLEETDLKIGSVDSRVKSSPKGNQARISQKNFIVTITAHTWVAQSSLIYELG